MSELVRALSNVLYRRFTYIKKSSVAGKHSYVYGPTGESEDEVWTILKKDMEVQNRIREEAGLDGLDESDIDRQAMNCLHTVPCNEEIVKEEDSDEDFEECIEVGKKVNVTNFGLNFYHWRL